MKIERLETFVIGDLAHLWVIASINEKVLTLPDELVVIPGHGELTTIGEERQTNPFLVNR